MILLTLFNISLLLIGDFVINKLSLNTKYPKLSKYIKIKQTLNKGYLIFYIILLFLITIIYIIYNIYMLVPKYYI